MEKLLFQRLGASPPVRQATVITGRLTPFRSEILHSLSGPDGNLDFISSVATPGQ
jgi:hypothetical protein